MNFTAIELLRQLQLEQDTKRKVALVTKLRAAFQENPLYLEASLKVSFSNAVRSALGRLSDGKLFYDVETTSYKDSDGALKVAVLIAFLQDYSSPQVAFEEELLALMVANVRQLNLESIVNDISVNQFQWRA